MIAAWSSIKGWLVAIVMASLVALVLMLKVSKAENATLSVKLREAALAHQVSQATIDTLTYDQAYLNRLLVSRATKAQQDERQLNETIQTLENQLANTKCNIPSAVTEQLRQPY